MAQARGDAFWQAQERQFGTADAAHFEWQVAGAGFAPLEAALLAPVAAAVAAPYLEVGCGEGANFVHVGGTGLRLGVDRFPAKVRFAAARVPGVAFAAADAEALPLGAGTVRTVLVRDCLHHVRAPERVLAEAVRVLAPGGRLFVIEPNGRNPLIAVQARVMAAERGLAASRRETLERWLGALPLEDLRLEMRQALPLRRLLLHHRMGLPRLGRVALAARALDGLEALLARALPQERWSYMVFSGRRAESG
jgi:SAM-dependent methyltransferase